MQANQSFNQTLPSLLNLQNAINNQSQMIQSNSYLPLMIDAGVNNQNSLNNSQAIFTK